MVTPELLKDLFVAFPTGVTVVTAIDQDGTPTGLTAGSFAGVSLDPPLMGLSISNSSQTLAAIRARGAYGVHILGDWQAPIARRFGSDTASKFSGVAHKMDGRGVPCIEDCLRSIVCDLEAEYAGGDHSIVLGRILELNPTGSDREMGAPLVYSFRQYHSVGAPVQPTE